MTKCGKHCVPCCDFCIYAKHDIFIYADQRIMSGPIGCKLHPDEEHQRIAASCGECEDFHCYRANDGEEVTDEDSM